MAGFAAPVSRFSNTIVDRIYDRQVRYQPNKHFQPHEEDGALSTQPHKSTKVWKQQKVLQYDENPQERVQEKVLAKLVPGQDGRQQIVETTQWPYSMFAQITMKFKGKTYGGSGAFVGPHHVLTCGHNVYDKDDNVWAEDITVYPALNDKHAPFGSVKVVKAYTFTQYTNLKDERYDIALLILNKSIGKYTGWAGMLSATDNQLSQEQVNIVGYPGDKGMTQMWGMKHTIHQIKQEQFEYHIDTNGGQSGSAIWISKFGAIMILGVHTTGGNYTNTGVRLSTEKFRVLVQKIAESYEREKPQGPAPQPILQTSFFSKQPQPSPPLTVSKQPSSQPAPAPNPLHSRPAMQPTLPPNAFGKEKWAQYFGDVGIEPPLPSDIEEILSQQCPFWPWNKVRDTHLLVLIPATINGQTFTLGTLGQLIRHPKQGYATQFNYVEDGLMSKSSWSSHWVLMTKRILDDSVGQEDYDAILKHYYKSYKRPTVLEAATCILMEHVVTGEKLYSNNPYTCARCEENDIMIGGFEKSGINMGFYPNLDHIGHTALRPLIAQYPATRTQHPSSNVPSPVPTPKEPSQPVVALPKTKPIVSDDWRVRQPISNVPFIREPSNSQMPEIAFGKAKWAQYFGDIGIEPPLPADIHQILNAPCPFWPEKRVQETHLLTLIPRTVNGQPFTLNSLGELIQRPLAGGNATQYNKYWAPIKKEYGSMAPASSYWVLMTKDVIPESLCKGYDAQLQVLATYNKKSRLPYEIPHLLESATGILMEHVQSEIRLYSDSQCIFTRCQERVSSHPDNLLVVGYFAADGLGIGHNFDDEIEGGGVAGCRKL